MDREVLATVLDRPVAGGELSRAWLHGYRRVRAASASYPILVPAPGLVVGGVVFQPKDERDDVRIRHFEDGRVRRALVGRPTARRAPARRARVPRARGSAGDRRSLGSRGLGERAQGGFPRAMPRMDARLSGVRGRTGGVHPHHGPDRACPQHPPTCRCDGRNGRRSDRPAPQAPSAAGRPLDGDMAALLDCQRRLPAARSDADLTAKRSRGEEPLRYPIATLYADYLRAAVGLALTTGPAAAARSGGRGRAGARRAGRCCSPGSACAPYCATSAGSSFPASAIALRGRSRGVWPGPTWSA